MKNVFTEVSIFMPDMFLARVMFSQCPYELCTRVLRSLRWLHWWTSLGIKNNAVLPLPRCFVKYNQWKSLRGFALVPHQCIQWRNNDYLISLNLSRNFGTKIYQRLNTGPVMPISHMQYKNNKKLQFFEIKNLLSGASNFDFHRGIKVRILWV